MSRFHMVLVDRCVLLHPALTDSVGGLQDTHMLQGECGAGAQVYSVSGSMAILLGGCQALAALNDTDAAPHAQGQTTHTLAYPCCSPAVSHTCSHTCSHSVSHTWCQARCLPGVHGVSKYVCSIYEQVPHLAGPLYLCIACRPATPASA